MLQYVIRRVLWVLLVVLLITFATFVIFFKMPAQDPAIALAGRQPTKAIIAQVREQLGLDKSFPVQYGLFVKRLFLGDDHGWPGLGYSYDTKAPVKGELFDRALVSTQLAAGGAVIWLIVGVSVGVVSALKRRSVADRAAMVFALFGVSAPVFLLGLIALFIFWQQLDISPGTGYVAFGENPGEWLSHMILPWCVLALLYAAFYARMIRGNLLEVLGEDYIRTARAKGLRERTVIGKHGLRASLTPVVTMFGMDFALLISGALLTETVFNIPGLGIWTVQSTFNGDLPVILAVVIVASLFVTVMNLIVDILYAYLDPRVRLA